MKNEVSFLNFGRDICGDFESATAREWLVTNGIGGYASGTISGVLTRRYHGLLIAACKPPLDRKLLVTKLDESVKYNGDTFKLFANRWVNKTIEPNGYRYIESFYLAGTIPVWNFAIGDALLEKRIWMQQGANTTYIRYELKRGLYPAKLTLKALTNDRDHNGETNSSDTPMLVEPVERGVKVVAYQGATPFYLLSDRAASQPRSEWYQNFSLSVEQNRGFIGVDDHFFAAEFNVTLQPGDSVVMIASTESNVNIDSDFALAERQNYEAGVLAESGRLFKGSPEIQHLLLAADQFIVRRSWEGEKDGHSVIAGYHWFGDWGRDAMISLPGLTISTGRVKIARSILRTCARYIDQGMLPNHFPDIDETPEYNTVDATLWYFEAIRAYYTATSDDALIKELFPTLKEIVNWHMRGTRYQIHVDPADGLLYAGESGLQLTWMDVKVGDWVVTPRTGKPVEINALWYHALCIMARFADRLGEPTSDFKTAAERVRGSFSKFWNKEAGYCFDVIDGPNGSEASLRPNQLFAISIPADDRFEPALLDHDQQKAIVEACARHLLTSHGLRSLTPFDPDYLGHYGGDVQHRDGAYHQGTVWGWLIGPFIDASLKVQNGRTDKRRIGRRASESARSYLYPLLHHLAAGGLGSISEIFDGDDPFTPRGCIAQAWSVAEVLRVWQATK